MTLFSKLPRGSFEKRESHTITNMLRRPLRPLPPSPDDRPELTLRDVPTHPACDIFSMLSAGEWSIMPQADKWYSRKPGGAVFSSERPGSLYVIPSKYETAAQFHKQHVSYYYKKLAYTEETKPPPKKRSDAGSTRKRDLAAETKPRKVRSDKGKKHKSDRKGRSDKGGQHKKKNYTLPFKMNPLFK